MKETILGIFEPLAQLNPLLYVLIIAMVPIVELRGAIPVGIAMGLPWWQVTGVAMVGSIIPAPFIVLFFKKFMDLAREKKWFPKLIGWLDKKFSKAHREFEAKIDDGKIDAREAKQIKGLERAKFWGIMIFTGIPLPGTGAWTASGVASIIEMPPKKAVGAVALGCLMAGVIVTIISLLGKTALQGI
ncbi:small multi-drug export protein [Microgenomates group bacterium]|nr:small multi-drug export protein [Microgenomates group bacterium]